MRHQNNDGDTVYHIAARKEFEFLKLINDPSMKPSALDIKNKEGLTPLGILAKTD